MCTLGSLRTLPRTSPATLTAARNACSKPKTTLCARDTRLGKRGAAVKSALARVKPSRCGTNKAPAPWKCWWMASPWGFKPQPFLLMFDCSRCCGCTILAPPCQSRPVVAAMLGSSTPAAVSWCIYQYGCRTALEGGRRGGSVCDREERAVVTWVVKYIIQSKEKTRKRKEGKEECLGGVAAPTEGGKWGENRCGPARCSSLSSPRPRGLC